MSKHYLDRSNDEEIIDIIQSIMSQGTMDVETVNESILVELMEKRGTPIYYRKSHRDIKQDFEAWKNRA